MVSDMDKSIDIAAGKIFDWLLDRRHCSAKWEKRVLPAREAAKELENEFADDPIYKELMSSFGYKRSRDELDFVFCSELLRRMEEKDGSAGWTGIGASNRVKKWSSVVSSYQKENAHWAECATSLTRLLQKELVSIERNSQKISQKQDECLKRNDALLKSAASCFTRYKEACSKLSVDSAQPIKPQILKELHSMPEKLLSINEKIASLAEVREYYLDFAAKSCQLEITTPSLDALKLIGEKPAATVFEYQEGRAPSKIIRDVNSEVYQTDFDLVEEVEVEDVEFEIEMIEEFELEEEDIEIEEESNGVLVNQTTVAKGKLALYLIEDAEIRQSLMDNIAELEAFCYGRQQLASGEELAKMNNWAKLIAQIEAELASPQLQNFFKLSEFPETADKIVHDLEVHKISASKRENEAKTALKEREELIEEGKRLQEEKKCVLFRINALKSFMEKALSDHYSGRTVRITGCRV